MNEQTPSPPAGGSQSRMKSNLIYAVCVVLLLSAAAFWPRDQRRGPEPGKDPKPPKVRAGSSKHWLGIRAAKGPVDPVSGRPKGVTIKAVVAGSPADVSGLLKGDVILEFASKRIDSPAALAKEMDATEPETAVAVKVRRAGKYHELKVQLEAGGSLKICETAQNSALAFLTQKQLEDGSFPHFHERERASPTMTAMVAWALAATVDPDDLESEARTALEAAIARLKNLIAENGALDTSGWDIGHQNYGTACAIMALKRHDAVGNKAEIEQLRRFLLANQVSEAHGYDAIDWRYGGFPYYESMKSQRLRTDISTASYVAAALVAADTPGDHRVWQRLGLFLDETQNDQLRGQDQDRAKEAPLRDGGFAFHPRDSKAGRVVISDSLIVYRSYGSATADGLRALIAVDGSSSSNKAVAALRWLARNYQLQYNPGFESPEDPRAQGIYFYYLHSLAQSLLAAKVVRISRKGESGEDEIHHWPSEIIRELAKRQRPNGAWRNKEEFMNENDELVATSLALLALDAAKQAVKLKNGILIQALKPAQTRSQSLPDEPLRTPTLRGLRVYQQKACIACHLDRYPSRGGSLVGVGDRFLEKQDGDAEAARIYMRKHIRNPKAYPGTRPVPGEEMLPYGPEKISGPELDDLVSFLLSRTGDKPVSDASLPGLAAPVDVNVGGHLYRNLCLTCHDPEKGHGPVLYGVGQRYLEAKKTKKAAREALAQHIRSPKAYPSMQPARKKGQPMPPFPKNAISDKDLSDLVEFLMTHNK